METHFSVRSPASVAEEMRRLKYEHAAEHLWFADDIFGLKPKWVCEFASEVERRRAAVPFKMQSRVDLMSAETVQALHRAGCIEVWMGVESGSQKILTAMDKGTRVDQVAVARESLRKEGIRACYFLQFGYPGENWQDIQKTIALGSRHSPRRYWRLCLLPSYPGQGSSIASAPNWARKPTGLTVKTFP